MIISQIHGDDSKWVWGGKNRDSSRNLDSREEASGRYDVYEDDRPFINYPPNGIGPVPEQYPGTIIHKPNGVYDNNNQNYGNGGQATYYPDDRPGPGILTGPVQEGPFKEFDRCKCTERFNCNTPGISYGHCDVGKRYCCYSTKKSNLGGPFPSRPIHSPENGVLVGPGGPSGGNYNQRPVGSFGSPARPGGFGLGGGRPIGFGGGQNVHSPANGVLVGPGGSSRPHYGLSNGYISRSASNQKD